MKEEQLNKEGALYEFRTKDSEEAAFLLTKDDCFRLVMAEPVEMYGKMSVWFTFESRISQEEVDSLRTDYRHRRCLVEPRKHADMRAEIRNLVRECRDKGVSKRLI